MKLLSKLESCSAPISINIAKDFGKYFKGVCMKEVMFGLKWDLFGQGVLV